MLEGFKERRESTIEKRRRLQLPHIMDRYSELMANFPAAMLDEAMLPVPKVVMKELLKLDWLLETDALQRSVLEHEFLFLARFQPGIGDQPVHCDFNPDGTPADAPSVPQTFLPQWQQLADETAALLAEFGTFKVTERRVRFG